MMIELEILLENGRCVIFACCVVRANLQTFFELRIGNDGTN